MILNFFNIYNVPNIFFSDKIHKNTLPNFYPELILRNLQVISSITRSFPLITLLHELQRYIVLPLSYYNFIDYLSYIDTNIFSNKTKQKNPIINNNITKSVEEKFTEISEQITIKYNKLNLLHKSPQLFHVNPIAEQPTIFDNYSVIQLVLCFPDIIYDLQSKLNITTFDILFHIFVLNYLDVNSKKFYQENTYIQNTLLSKIQQIINILESNLVEHLTNVYNKQRVLFKHLELSDIEKYRKIFSMIKLNKNNHDIQKIFYSNLRKLFIVNYYVSYIEMSKNIEIISSEILYVKLKNVIKLLNKFIKERYFDIITNMYKILPYLLKNKQILNYLILNISDISTQIVNLLTKTKIYKDSFRLNTDDIMNVNISNAHNMFTNIMPMFDDETTTKIYMLNVLVDLMFYSFRKYNMNNNMLILQLRNLNNLLLISYFILEDMFFGTPDILDMIGVHPEQIVPDNEEYYKIINNIDKQLSSENVVEIYNLNLDNIIEKLCALNMLKFVYNKQTLT